jgi:hypothetical protein
MGTHVEQRAPLSGSACVRPDAAAMRNMDWITIGALGCEGTADAL